MHSRALQMLYDEHEVILQAADRVEALLTLKDISKEVKTLQDLVTFFRQYGDLYHHHKEEDILFSLLMQKNERLATGILSALTEHHELFREVLKKTEQAIMQKEWKVVRDNLKQYVDDLTDHIGAENEELFVVAEQLLDEEEKSSLYFSFLDKDRELGEDRKKEYEAKILDRS